MSILIKYNWKMKLICKFIGLKFRLNEKCVFFIKLLFRFNAPLAYMYFTRKQEHAFYDHIYKSISCKILQPKYPIHFTHMTAVSPLSFELSIKIAVIEICFLKIVRWT